MQIKHWEIDVIYKGADKLHYKYTGEPIEAMYLIGTTFEILSEENENNMKNTVTEQEINKLIEEAEIDVKTVFEKCTVVTVKLANGFVLTESSACVDKANYNEELGKDICLERIKNKLWELEGYKLQCKLKGE